MNDPGGIRPLNIANMDSNPSFIALGNPGIVPPELQQIRSASSYTDMPYLFGVQDPNMIAPKPKGNRRKSTQGPDHIKHRRTRSGCYTCRSRRVKCDEARPICQRCRKGSRDCVYPEKVPSSKVSPGSASKSSDAHDKADSASSEDDGPFETDHLEAILDEDESGQESSHVPARSQISQSFNQRRSPGSGSDVPAMDKASSPSPSTASSTSYAASPAETSYASPIVGPDGMRSDWSHLPEDLQFFLSYFYTNITSLHYNLKTDPDNFFKTFFLDAALRDDALLNALVGFAAYQYMLEKQVGKIQDFLQYYNKAVSKLLRSLRKGKKHDVGTVLTILQLATIEEHLGDWVNLFGHQKAAHKLLIELYTPETIMMTATTRAILYWYVRFDVSVGLLGGFGTVLPRRWPAYAVDFYRLQSQKEPENLKWKIETLFAEIRLLGMDASVLFAKKGKGEITHEEYLRESALIGQRLEEWKINMDPAVCDERYLVTDFSGCPPLDPDSIVNPYQPNYLYGGPLFSVNLAWVDWYGMDIMYRYQTALMSGQQPGPDIVKQAYTSCQLIDAIEKWPESPKGKLLGLHSGLGISALFLPRDERHSMWVRRKYARIECEGFIFPHTFRTKFAALFRDPSCLKWWLPNDEGYPPMLRSVRNFVEERTSRAGDVPSEDLRDMKSIFSKLRLDDDQPETAASASATAEKDEMKDERTIVKQEMCSIPTNTLQDWPPAGLPMGGQPGDMSQSQVKMDQGGGISSQQPSMWEGNNPFSRPPGGSRLP